jgi:hypothetical protein
VEAALRRPTLAERVSLGGVVLLIFCLGAHLLLEIDQRQRHRRLVEVVRTMEILQSMFWAEHQRYAVSAAELGAPRSLLGSGVFVEARPGGFRVAAWEKPGWPGGRCDATWREGGTGRMECDVPTRLEKMTRRVRSRYAEWAAPPCPL